MTEQRQPRRKQKQTGQQGMAPEQAMQQAQKPVRVRLLRPHVHGGAGYDAGDVIDVHPETARWMRARALID